MGDWIGSSALKNSAVSFTNLRSLWRFVKTDFFSACYAPFHLDAVLGAQLNLLFTQACLRVLYACLLFLFSLRVLFPLFYSVLRYFPYYTCW